MPPTDVEALSATKRALLAQRMSGRAAARPPSSGPLIPETRSGPVPLSPLQEQLWYFSRLSPENLVYNEAATIRKDGPLDDKALRTALAELIRRHQILRSRFKQIDDQPMQVVDPVPRVELPVVDISGLPAAEREAEAARIATDQAKRPYDLERGPPVRFTLVRFATDHHRLYLALHQLVFDCVSLYGIVLPELISLYDSARVGHAPSLPEPAVQYADYALWLRERSTGDELRSRIDYWRDHLDAAPTLRLPLDRERDPNPRFHGAIERVTIPSELADELRALGRAHRGTLYQVLAAAFTVLLQRYCDQDEIVFGTLGDLRDRRQLQSLVGYCVTPVVLRADLGDDPTFGELVSRIRRDLLDGLSQLVPFDQLVGELRPRRIAGANPIFQAALVLQPPTVAPDPAWSIRQMEPEAGNAIGNAKFDLNFELDERLEGHLDGRVIYRTDVLTPATAARLARDWVTLLHAVVAAPASRVSELSVGAPPAPRPASAPVPAVPVAPVTPLTPRTVLEQRIAAIWARTLRLDSVGVEDDFFALGGNSLLAMRLLVEVERQLGDEIPLAAFVTGNVTVAGMAATIEATRGGTTDELSTIRIQADGTLPTLFFAVADERSVLPLRHLMGPLGADQPVVGLLPDRVHRRFDRSTNVAELIAPMLATIRQAQPHGPYFLSGYSLGGTFAYELAGRLLAEGEQVAWLALLDTCTAELAGKRWQPHKRAARGWKGGPRKALDKLAGVVWRELAARLVRLGLREPKLSDAFDHRGALMLATSHVCRGHRAPLDLFATDDTVAGAGSDSLGWAAVHRGWLRVHRLGGDHVSMFEHPQIDTLAAEFSASAREALKASS